LGVAVPHPPSKASLKSELTGVLVADLETRERAHVAARTAATHDEAKPENDKDTRALEQSYLARGEAARVEELRAAIADVQAMPLRAFGPGDPVGLGALVKTDESGKQTLFWLAPHGGGNHLAQGSVQVVTPKSPLGRAILGKRADDECAVVVAGKTRILTIVCVS
jgi:transcription elongation GreA/GreB family factor